MTSLPRDVCSTIVLQPLPEQQLILCYWYYSPGPPMLSSHLNIFVLNLRFCSRRVVWKIKFQNFKEMLFWKTNEEIVLLILPETCFRPFLVRYIQVEFNSCKFKEPNWAIEPTKTTRAFRELGGFNWSFQLFNHAKKLGLRIIFIKKNVGLWCH